MNHKGKGHGWMMVLCLIPIAAIFLLPRFGVELGPLGRMAPYAIFLICPIMHIGMMVFMFKDKKGEGHHGEEAVEQNRQ
ncbi:DUF2933 domain-containing protein [Isachenkonia alkalipeptolytica]|uniref:DUF2933 domain-containing protein n=1 Tax=Isachenkonia alkalipeptolytica TaxID=2565777 RepID=A0AA44BF53_9CLOT|nr:DUF2933 domain-containing protein [Isachenkonia alkalipeptolytica]NBG88830.1 DUF2933 domain-containing protein [Isachenkonia alkalipeptolytica]